MSHTSTCDIYKLSDVHFVSLLDPCLGRPAGRTKLSCRRDLVIYLFCENILQPPTPATAHPHILHTYTMKQSNVRKCLLHLFISPRSWFMIQLRQAHVFLNISQGAAGIVYSNIAAYNRSVNSSDVSGMSDFKFMMVRLSLNAHCFALSQVKRNSALDV